jgi:hypothetical protein
MCSSAKDDSALGAIFLSCIFLFCLFLAAFGCRNINAENKTYFPCWTVRPKSTPNFDKRVSTLWSGGLPSDHYQLNHS